MDHERVPQVPHQLEEQDPPILPGTFGQEQLVSPPGIRAAGDMAVC